MEDQGAPSSNASLEVVREELHVRLAEQERRGTAFDSRAGLVVGFGGILIGISPIEPSLSELLAQVMAAAAATAAGSALLPRQGDSLGIRPLRERYLTQDPDVTRLRVFDTRLWLSEKDDAVLKSKALRLTWAARLLGGAVLLMLCSSILDYIR